MVRPSFSECIATVDEHPVVFHPRADDAGTQPSNAAVHPRVAL